MNIELEQQVTIDLDKLTDADRKALRAVLDEPKPDPKPFPQKGDYVAAMRADGIRYRSYSDDNDNDRKYIANGNIVHPNDAPALAKFRIAYSGILNYARTHGIDIRWKEGEENV